VTGRYDVEIPAARGICGRIDVTMPGYAVPHEILVLAAAIVVAVAAAENPGLAGSVAVQAALAESEAI